MDDVLIMCERLGKIYYFFVQAMIRELGEERAREVVREVIKEYGQDIGRQNRDRVCAAGLEPNVGNYSKGKDLPSQGWNFEPICVENHNSEVKVSSCPLADVWKDLDFEAWGRLYCEVDQAKYGAYSDNLCCEHKKNILDGDPYCIIHAKKKS